MEQEEDKSQKKDEPDHQISRVSLKVTSECVNLQNRNTLKLTSSIQINKSHQSAKEIDINLEGAGTSNAITVLYNKNSFICESADSMFTEGELIGNECIVLNVSENINDPIRQQLQNQHKDGECKATSTSTIKTVISNSSRAESIVAVEHPVECEINITPPELPPLVLYSAPPLIGGPPTYSAVMRIGPTEIASRRSLRIFGRRPEVRLQPSPPFIAPMPPPSYAEAQGLCVTQPRTIIPNPTLDLQDTFWGPEPISVICTQCNNFVITTIHTQRSGITHFTAVTLCLCGCWPCCLLPYCLNVCKSTIHECPVCHVILDMQDSLWGPEPVSVICPNCNNFIITAVHTRRSNLTHFSALALCICGCWPCCLLPYCIKACKTTYHECPVCRNTIGVFNPW